MMRTDFEGFKLESQARILTIFIPLYHSNRKGFYVKRRFYFTLQNIPAGDQPDAIARLVDGVESGATHQTLKGITGSGKTFTMANIIHRLKRPTLILAPNKTLTAQLYEEMKHFFPENAVEFFVSYYDYFQPEIYLPGNDRFIEKDSSINEHLERLRLSATKSLIERRDTIVVASVSSIYGVGSPKEYKALKVHLALGKKIKKDEFEQDLAQLQYERTKRSLKRGTYRSGSLFNIEHSNGGLITFPGGVVLKNRNGDIIGAVGVSGDTVENDHLVASAAASVIK